MSNKKIPFHWKCPKCKSINRWEWDKWDIIAWINSPGRMECDYCRESPKMSLEFVKVKE
jgi:hypothetical protein